MTHRERLMRGDVVSDHVVQFFDTTESLADSVGAFLQEGHDRGAALLVVAKPRNWDVIALQLKNSGGLRVAAELEHGRLTVLDAHDALSEFMRDTLPDSILFHEAVGMLVARLAGNPGGLRIYGEMVEILAEEENFHGAQRLEELWNELAVRHSFSLMCGYSAAHFTSRDARPMLGAICHAHNRVKRSDADLLAQYLLDSQTVRATTPVDRAS